ncbi:MAG: alpha/beta hydrolase [Bacilli bacterium]|nr:alpha/beta hydrolase [Bacilli bacterium]
MSKNKNKNTKLLFKILLGIVIVLFLLILVVFTIHKIKSNNEYNELKDLGYINKYSAGDYDLNIHRIGNKNSKHKLIGISGLGVHNYSIEMSFVNEQLKDDYELIYIDRAGYGYSDDTSKTQTVEQIVSDYRTALKSAGIEGPYILMPHSIGGVYATYWESIYPDEIEGVIFIDGTPLGMNIYEKSDYSVSFSDYFDVFLCKLGFQRFSIRFVSDPLPSEYTKEQQKLTDYLNIKSSMNKAPLSEIKEKNNNANKAYQRIKSNDIPKIYIESSRGARTIEEVKEDLKWVTKRKQELGLETISTMPSDNKLTQLIEQNMKLEKEQIIPYTDLLGNTEIKLLSGDHYIFEQKPDELARIIKDYINDLDK